MDYFSISRVFCLIQYLSFCNCSADARATRSAFQSLAKGYRSLIFICGAFLASSSFIFWDAVDVYKRQVVDLAIRLSVGDDRIEQLRWCFDNETNAPETQEWRERLTEEEADLVEHWQTQYDNGFVKMCSDCVKYATDRD